MENNISYQRRCAVSKAWSKERKQVLQSRGSRNWSQKEQREIIATGKCHGYEGQHMLSVKSHPEHAGNEKNIQFLTHEEHFQAHGGNWKNDANGRFNLKTKKVNSFDGELPGINYRKLSDPLSDRSKKIANTKYEKSKAVSKTGSNAERTKQSKRPRLPVKKTSLNSSANKKASSRDLFVSRANGSSSPKGTHTNQKSSVKNNSKGNGISS